MSIATHHKEEIKTGSRFTFGDNWSQFLKVLDDQRIIQAENSLKRMLDVENLSGKSFLDIGSGSGLFSLAARRLGANVFSFDYDPDSVACTKKLKKRYFENDKYWAIESGSVLDSDYLKSLGKFDIVYSWGVLHHTGDMWNALQNVEGNVADNGLLFISLYNNQGIYSKIWLLIKKIYNKLPRILRGPFAILVYLPREFRALLNHSLHGQPFYYFKYIKNYKDISLRGMSWWHDKIDWIGGLPFEVSKPEEIFSFFSNRGFTLCKLKTCGGGSSCNEYIFRRNS